MTDFIDREAAINELNELFTICRETMPNENGKHYVVEEELCVFYNRLSNIPAADVRPVVRGRWVEDWETGCSECSNCGDGFLWEDFKGVAAWNFCPNCGAEMEES